MFPLWKKNNRVANIVIDDYVIRIIENKGSDLDSVRMLAERPIDPGLIQQGKIMDEIGFYEFMKRLVKECGLKRCDVRFHVPNPLVIMRQVEFPLELEGEAVRDHFLMEVGNSIHLPFQQPVLDVHVLGETEDGQQQAGIMFAAEEEEVMKYANIFEDCGLRPVVADVQALSIYRYFQFTDQAVRDRVYLFLELNLTSSNLSIYHHGQPEFMRFQHLGLEAGDWLPDTAYTKWANWTYKGREEDLAAIMDEQVNELERVMNFYRYSQHQGEQKVDEIILTGDYPALSQVGDLIHRRYEMPVRQLEGVRTPADDEAAAREFIPVLGLALKGGASHAS